MKFLRISISILVLFLSICLLVVASFAFFVDPNNLKPRIIREVKLQTGYDIAINGKISWSFLPPLSIEAPAITLSANKSKVPFAQLTNVKISSSLIDWFSKQTLIGKIYIQKIVLNKIQASDVRVNLDWQNATLTLDPITATLYGGKLTGIAHGRNLANVPQWDWKVQVTNTQLKPLLDDVNGTASKIKLSGLGNMAMEAATMGKDNKMFIENLNGKINIHIEKGSVEGFDLNYLIESAGAMLDRKSMPVASKTNTTQFSALTGHALIQNGMVNTNDLVLKAPQFNATAEATLSLLLQTMQIRMQVSAPSLIKQWQVPIEITGSFSQPNIQLDLNALQKLLVSEEFNKIQDKVSSEINRIPEKVNQFMQNFLGQ